MTNNKTYILMWYFNGKGEEILRGSAPLMQFKKAQLKNQHGFQKGRFTIISEQGLKYNYGFIKP